MNNKVDSVKDETKEEIHKLNTEIVGLKTEVMELKSIVLTLTEKLGVLLGTEPPKPEQGADK